MLALVLVDELLATAAFGIWDWQHDPRWLLGWLLPVAAMLVWFFASRKAAYGGTAVRPVAKVVVLGLATLALWDAGHETRAVVFLAISVAVNALVLLPSTRVLVESEYSASRLVLPRNLRRPGSSSFRDRADSAPLSSRRLGSS